MSTTVKAVTARKRHRCEADRRHGVGIHAIAPGHQYLRHVMFPGDINGSSQPWVIRECVACACTRDDAGGALQANACGTFCCGDTPCARPFKHDGDHSCVRCAFQSREAGQ